MRRNVLLLLFICAPAFAQTSPLFPRFSVIGGAYQGNFSTDVRLDEDASTGTLINLERDLGLDEEKQLQRFAIQWRPFARHELAASTVSASRSGFERIDREITFRDTTYPVQAEVATDFDVDYWDVTYTYWARRTERDGFGIMLGAATMSIDASLIATSPAGGVTITQDASTDVPVALAGVQGRFAFTPKLLAEASVGVLPRVTIEEYSGRALNAAARIEYRVARFLGVGAAYHDFRLDGSVARDDFSGDLDLAIRGPEAFVRLTFE